MLEGYPSEAKRAPGRARRLAGDNPLQALPLVPFSPPANKYLKRLFSASAGKQPPEVFLAVRREKTYSLNSRRAWRTFGDNLNTANMVGTDMRAKARSMRLTATSRVMTLATRIMAR